MKPTTQTTFGVPEGNCTSACFASLLDVPIELVPHFGSDAAWCERLRQWLRPQGYDAMFWLIEAGPPWQSVAGTWRFVSDTYVPEGYYILGGQSPRGPHAVVAKGHEIVFDPHPSRAGLLSIEDGTAVFPLDPAAWFLRSEFTRRIDEFLMGRAEGEELETG